MINSVQISPSFQKRIVAKVDLPSQNGVENCSIYELDEGKKDAKRLKKQIKKQGWNFADQFIGHLKDKNNPEIRLLNVKVFSLEDENKNCLGLMKAFDFGYMKNIDYIEVNPCCRSELADGKVQNVGTALMTYLLKANQNREFIVLHPIKNAYGFYDKMGFERQKTIYNDNYYLTADKVSQSIENNEQRIGSNVELLG